jgi:hypothetical protein
MQGKFSEMQKSRFVIRKNVKVKEHLCNMFINSQMDPKYHEKNNFKNIEIVLRVLDKLW